MKAAILIFSAVLMASVSLAQENFMIEGDNAYKILNEITSGDGVSFMKYMILENQTELNELRSKDQELSFSIMTASFESRKLEGDNAKAEEKIAGDNATLSKIETERNEARDILKAVEEKKTRLEKTINSSVLMSPGSYNIGVALFLILVILAVTMKSRSILLRNQMDMKRRGIEKDRAKS